MQIDCGFTTPEDGTDMLSTLAQNIMAGTRLALMRPVNRSAFRANIGQVILFLVIGVLFDASYDYAITEPSGSFSQFDVKWAFLGVLLFLCGTYLITRIQQATYTLPAIVVLYASTWPIVYVVFAVIDWSFRFIELDWLFGLAALVVVLAALGWVIAISFRVIRLQYTTSRKRAWLLVMILMAGAMAGDSIQIGLALSESDLTARVASEVESAGKKSKKGPDKWAEYRKLDVENTYYAQPSLMAKATESMRPQRPGVVDLYFIAFGSYAYQNVFQSETRAVRTLFDERFDTAGRSLVLVNSLLTVKSEPLASARNLRRAIAEVARRMDPEEDILFLFLTSHGSEDHALSVNFWPLQLNDLHHHDLEAMLDDAGIKWRVVVVSACYSGGFIETLDNDFSLVMTASRADRNSFGCSNKLAFTYFGQAYFDEQLRRRFSFIEAFNIATEVIKDREKSEGLRPSIPQIYVGKAIVPKLDVLERRLKTLNERASR